MADEDTWSDEFLELRPRSGEMAGKPVVGAAVYARSRGAAASPGSTPTSNQFCRSILPCRMPTAPIRRIRAFVASSPVVSVPSAAAAIAISGVAPVAGFIPAPPSECPGRMLRRAAEAGNIGQISSAA